eukprot:CAMPEP_0198296428 /NCGR_PEP_ID=MMETSP1449-20131203/32476_1 /TAXON_ID=420275 /ORGANISM="Attheya septentrionalis, Strain CCMP2084" /LENGTH=94 /DNA_ID=CAMNT_0043997045 /DNA_START=110 /DNA_END=391 /DNA_ORIENTATION=+
MVTGIQSASFFQPLSKKETEQVSPQTQGQGHGNGGTNTVVTDNNDNDNNDDYQEGEQERELKGIYSEMRTRQRAAILQAGAMRPDVSFDASERY